MLLTVQHSKYGIYVVESPSHHFIPPKSPSADVGDARSRDTTRNERINKCLFSGFTELYYEYQRSPHYALSVLSLANHHHSVLGSTVAAVVVAAVIGVVAAALAATTAVASTVAAAAAGATIGRVC